MLKALLGLGEPEPLPKPNRVMGTPGATDVFKQARVEGTAEELLKGLAEQNVLEALTDGSRLPYLSCTHSYVHYCDTVGTPPSQQLKVAEGRALQWIALLEKQKTAASYRSHMKFACALAKESVLWDTGLASAAIKAKGKQDGSYVPTHKWVCQKSLRLLMIRKAVDLDTPRLAVLLIVRYAFQFRVFS